MSYISELSSKCNIWILFCGFYSIWFLFLQINAEFLRRSQSDLAANAKNEDEIVEKRALINQDVYGSNLSLFPSHDCDAIECRQFYTHVCRYKRQVVAVKKVYKSNINMSRMVKKELKLLRDITNQNNQNLTKFMGACVDEPNICVVWEYCERGSLQDILYNEDLSLESMFIASLVFDIIRGLCYLHDSDLRFHGNLKSSNCVVDSRWVLKLTDFSLNEFKSGQSLDHLDEDAYFQVRMSRPSWFYKSKYRIFSMKPSGSYSKKYN